MMNGCRQRGPSGLEKDKAFEFSILVDFLRVSKNRHFRDFFFFFFFFFLENSTMCLLRMFAANI